MTEPEDTDAKTISTYEKFGRVWVRNNNVRHYWWKYMKMLQHYVPRGKILDIGCGGGRDAADLIELGYDYTGIDPVDTFLELARQRLPGHKFYKQSLYNLDFNKKFDAFWCCAVLLHVPKARMNEALQSIKSVLKPDAYGCITVKDGEGEGLQKDMLEDSELERFFSYWKKDDFAKVLNNNGFEVIEYDYFPASQKTRWHCFIVKLK